ncbi:MAG: zinc-ribbon domain-containing protein, partial [Pseudolabrys sp.]
MVSDPLTDGWYVGTSNTRTYMLIVCPNCSTSYTIEPGSLGSAGRTVRCARCKTTWFADTSPAEMTALADGAIDESDAHESPGVIRPDRGPDHAGIDMD